MATTIAVTGKGGTGKTVVAALTVLTLVERGWRPLLAVDADPNLNLDAALGMKVEETVGSVRERARDEAGEGGMTMAEFLDYRVRQSLVEGRGFDLLAMGRPEGPGCYCYANEILRNVLSRVAATYKAIVIDCEAGLEHFSRRTTGDLDFLIVLSDPTLRGLQTARRILDLVDELHTRVGDVRIVVNRVADGLGEEVAQAAAGLGLHIAAVLPEEPQVAALDAAGRPLMELAPDSPLRQAVVGLLTEAGLIR
jgi:CO dehydrogenase maturation factor